MGDVATTLSFVDATRIFTISGTDFKYYYKGKEVTIATSATIDLTSAITSAAAPMGHFIYFNSDTGVLTTSTSMWDLAEHVPVAYIYWNSATTTGVGAVFDERHGYRRDINWHKWAHSSINTRYLSGFVKTLPTLGTPNDIEIAGGSIADEDIITTVATPQTNVRVWYETSAGVWTFQGTSGSPWQLPYYDTTHPAGGSPEWPLTTSSYTMTTLAVGKYMPTWIFATPDKDYPIYVVVPSMTANNLYNSALAARQAPLPTTPFIQEGKLLYRFVWSSTGALDYVASSDDYRTSGVVASAGVSTNISASQVSFAPTGNVVATTVQGAFEEIISDIRPTYSEIIMTTTGALTVTTGGTYYTVNDTNVSGTTNFTIGQNANITTSATNCTFTIIDTGVYETVFTMSFNNSNINRINRGRFYVDGSVQTGGFINSGNNTATAQQNVTATQYMSLTAGQVVDFRLTADTSGTVFNMSLVNFRLRRIA